MRLYNIILLTLAGLVVFASAKPQDDGTGNTDLSTGGDGTDAGGATDTGNTQSTGGTDDGTGDGMDGGSGADDGSDSSDGNGGGDNGGGNNNPNPGGDGNGHMPSGMMDFFRGKGPFGGWPGFALGGPSGGGPPQLRARSFRFGSDKYTSFHRRGFGGFRSHQHSARDNIQNSGPSFNSVWYGTGKINTAS